MIRLAVFLAFFGVFAFAHISTPKNGDELVSTVMGDCGDMGCVKHHVLHYLDHVLHIKSDSRSIKNVDAALFKRVARILKTHEFRMKLPQVLFGDAEMVYNPKTGLDVKSSQSKGRGLLKKKLLLPALLLLKLKMKALMPIFVAIIGLKAMKALILSKLAIAIVLGFVIYQLCTKAGMQMPMMMTPMPPIEPPSSMYGPAAPSTPPPSSYEPGWEPSNGNGPYSRVWSSVGSGSSSHDASNIAYSAYYPGSSSTTVRP